MNHLQYQQGGDLSSWLPELDDDRFALGMRIIQEAYKNKVRCGFSEFSFSDGDDTEKDKPA
jgi:hypothetical protein